MRSSASAPCAVRSSVCRRVYPGHLDSSSSSDAEDVIEDHDRIARQEALKNGATSTGSLTGSTKERREALKNGANSCSSLTSSTKERTPPESVLVPEPGGRRRVFERLYDDHLQRQARMRSKQEAAAERREVELQATCSSPITREFSSAEDQQLLFDRLFQDHVERQSRLLSEQDKAIALREAQIKALQAERMDRDFDMEDHMQRLYHRVIRKQKEEAERKKQEMEELSNRDYSESLLHLRLHDEFKERAYARQKLQQDHESKMRESSIHRNAKDVSIFDRLYANNRESREQSPEQNLSRFHTLLREHSPKCRNSSPNTRRLDRTYTSGRERSSETSPTSRSFAGSSPNRQSFAGSSPNRRSFIGSSVSTSLPSSPTSPKKKAPGMPLARVAFGSSARSTRSPEPASRAGRKPPPQPPERKYIRGMRKSAGALAVEPQEQQQAKQREPPGRLGRVRKEPGELAASPRIGRAGPDGIEEARKPSASWRAEADGIEEARSASASAEDDGSEGRRSNGCLTLAQGGARAAHLASTAATSPTSGDSEPMSSSLHAAALEAAAAVASAAVATAAEIDAAAPALARLPPLSLQAADVKEEDIPVRHEDVEDLTELGIFGDEEGDEDCQEDYDGMEEAEEEVAVEDEEAADQKMFTRSKTFTRFYNGELREFESVDWGAFGEEVF